MCNLYTGTRQDRYDSDCRSIRIQGCVTSIRLENEFWKILDQMAFEEQQTVPQFINVLYDEILDSSSSFNDSREWLKSIPSVISSWQETINFYSSYNYSSNKENFE